MAKTQKPLRVKKGSTTVRVILIVVLCFSILISVYPFLYMLALSFMETTTMKLDWNRLVNAEFTMENYISIFQQADFLTYIKNSAIVTVYGVVLNCTVCALAAYAFAKKKFVGRNKVFTGYLATMMIPGQVTLIPTFLILKELGLLNTYSALGLTSCGAFGVFLIKQFMEKIPNELLEAADIDGCGELRKLFQVVLPLLKPVLISLAIFTFISVWGSLVLPLITNTEADMTTLTVALANIKTNRTQTNYGFMMAASTISFLPPFILYLLMQKQFVEGIALSGTKT